jgi:hypothetical protein
VWSPDGRWIAFVRYSPGQAGIWLIPAFGGTERKVGTVNSLDTNSPRVLAWHPDNQHLIVAGVSNWGAYALIGALAVLREDGRTRLLACLDEKVDKAVLEATVEHGPAVDGVSRLRAMTVDSFEMSVHHDKLREIRALVEAELAL